MEIPIGRGRVAIIDDEDWELVKDFKWVANKSAKNHVYVIAQISLHRLLMGLKPGDKRQVDHIDGDGLNNRRSNLRVVTVLQNARNRKKTQTRRHPRVPSPYKGVRYQHREPPLKKPWQAQIKVAEKQESLGYYATAEEAALAYNKAALEHFGEHAWLNEIGTGAE
jgi:hypothetical protein